MPSWFAHPITSMAATNEFLLALGMVISVHNSFVQAAIFGRHFGQKENVMPAFLVAFLTCRQLSRVTTVGGHTGPYKVRDYTVPLTRSITR